MLSKQNVAVAVTLQWFNRVKIQSYTGVKNQQNRNLKILLPLDATVIQMNEGPHTDDISHTVKSDYTEFDNVIVYLILSFSKHLQ